MHIKLNAVKHSKQVVVKHQKNKTMTQQQIEQMRVNSIRQGLTMYGEYVAGAMDASEWQRKKDIQIMRQWLEREYAYNCSMAVITPDMIDEICKAVEEE